MKITFPPMSEDQDSWALYMGGGNSVSYIPQRWYHRAIYRVLMYGHDRAQDMWSWCWQVSRRFAPIPKIEYVEPTLYGYVNSNGEFCEAAARKARS
jgi:hypothetical protein